MVENEEKKSKDFQEEIPAGNKERNSEGVGGFVMSKSVFVLETPKVCFGYGCIFAESGTYGGLYCKALHRFCEEPSHHKERDCPLIELPEEESNDHCYDLWERGWNTGWNECLKAILGDESNLSSEV